MQPNLDKSFNGFLQQVANAISTVLHFDVTVVNRELVRVAGTGRYSALIGQRLPASSSFADVVSKNRPYMVADKAGIQSAKAAPSRKAATRLATCATP